jgi:dTDP-4-amino-4,6-dideoxygalactose transaminase
MNVNFTDLHKLIPNKKLLFYRINALLKNNQLIGGKEIKNFEKEFATFTNSKFSIAVANGTDALEIAIKSLKLKKYSEIIVPANTWISTAAAVVSNGFKLIFCDVDLDDYTICLSDLKKKITSKTSCIIPVHLYGNPVNMYSIKRIIRNKNIKIIEDCAQAQGSFIKGKHVGTFGDIGTFSFFPSKNIGGIGDGGAIITNNKRIFDFCIRYRNHGALGKYDHKFVGRNSRLDCINSCLIREKIKKYRKTIKKRISLAELYHKNLQSIKNIKLFKYKKNFSYSYHQFVIRLLKEKERDKLRLFLKKNKIETMIHYPYMLNELNFFNYKKKLKNCNRLGKKILSLPISEEHSFREINYICKLIRIILLY